MEIDACKPLNIIPSLGVIRSALIVTLLIIIANVTDCDKSNLLCVSNSVGFVRVYKEYLYCKNFVIAKCEPPLYSSIDLLTEEQTSPEFTPTSCFMTPERGEKFVDVSENLL